MKKTIIAVISVLLILALTSCGGGLIKLALKAVDQDESLLIGTWEGSYDTMIFTEDEVTIKDNSGSSKTYKYRTNVYTLYIKHSSYDEVYNFKVNEDTLTLTYAEGIGTGAIGVDKEYKRVKD